MKDKLQKIIKKSSFLSWLKLKWFQRKWRSLNKNNFTIAANAFNVSRVSVGNGTYGSLYVYHFGADEERLQIGNYCSIGPECAFVLGGEHDIHKISTYPFQAKYGNCKNESISKGPIIIDDDVWLGLRTTILSGVHIGQGAVVAAGAVVTKDVSPYTVVGGVPAKQIKVRFTEEMVKELLSINYKQLTETDIKQHLNELNKTLENKDQLDWLMKQD